MLVYFRRFIASDFRVSIFSSKRFRSTLALNSLPDQRILNPNPDKPVDKSDLENLVLQQFCHGKFFNLVGSVVSTPSVLLAACRNLICSSNGGNGAPDSLLECVSKRFSIEDMALELRENRFDVEAFCVSISPSREKGESLILPNLKLKVVIEAVRMVLEVVYDSRFATFAYGGRVGMGRHTAIRYLKNAVENPSWWFCVRFKRHKFDIRHFRKLSSFIEEKIEDKYLIDILRRLFESEAAQIELGGCYLGRGFPQESSLSSILINIYFNGFDKEIQGLRLRMDGMNPKFDANELSSRVIHKPVKIYAVRYLDEILLITSGSRRLMLDLKNQVVKFLEGVLELNVDKWNTVIHSAVSEKIDFMGMELRAVTPSVLHPPMSDKAIRARKKYIKQKEAKALELKKSRETNRKKLGLKILNHVFKKLKHTDQFKFDLQIESEVRDIFRTWADEVLQDFLGSLEERWNWHRKLSAGDFLSLKVIRDQLPQDLVDSYDLFQEQVDKYLNPVKARKALEEEAREVEDEESRNYAEQTVEDLTKLCMKVSAPEDLVRKTVKMVGFTNSMGRPRPIELLTALEDVDIVKWYAGVGRRWLYFYCCCSNFKMVKIVVSYHLRFSCFLTLAEKHNATKKETIRHYTKDLKVLNVEDEEEMPFPTEKEIKMMGDKNLLDPKPVDGALSMVLIRLVSDEPSYSCVAHFCDRMDTKIYRIRLLQTESPIEYKNWVWRLGSIHESLNRKCLPLCSDHISELYLGRISLQDMDCTSFVDVN